MGLLLYLAGGTIGFLATLVLLAGTWNHDLPGWASTNLGSSIWLFGACLAGYLLILIQLGRRLRSVSDYEAISQLDQLSDVLIHVFIGIGVVWTAIGMRNALVTTLAVPGDLGGNATHVLGRLVDGGILLALSTTIVGAIGGYVMRLLKTVSLGAALTGYYRDQSMQPVENALGRLGNIEHLLEEIRTDRGRL